jgi:hypothetical protein
MLGIGESGDGSLTRFFRNSLIPPNCSGRMDLRDRNTKAKRTCKFAGQMGLLLAKIVKKSGITVFILLTERWNWTIYTFFHHIRTRVSGVKLSRNAS